MGGGSTEKTAPARRASSNASASPGASGSANGSGGAGGQTSDFCSLTQSLEFESKVVLEAGAAISLAAGMPPRVCRGSAIVGEVTDPLADAIGQCLLEGYTMRGAVESFDEPRRVGRVRVTGERK